MGRPVDHKSEYSNNINSDGMPGLYYTHIIMRFEHENHTPETLPFPSPHTPRWTRGRSGTAGRVYLCVLRGRCAGDR